MILLDTNVVSETMKPAPSQMVQRWLDEQAAETLYLSSVTIAEAMFGIRTMPDGKRKQGLAEALDVWIGLFEGRILPFDLDASKAYATLMAAARGSGKAIGTADGYIAATALAHGFSVATRDVSPFEAAGLKVINPWAVAT